MVDYAKRMRKELQRGAELNLSEDEKAFYDALVDNESAKEVLRDKVLMAMAKELVDTIHKNMRTTQTVQVSA
jgi:type I restriction enzyme, R subunit